jgi:nitrogen-specific signal transduction histidine kinase/CheY-like chemotaxis protein
MNDPKPHLRSTIEHIKNLLESNPENIERFLASHRYGNIGNMVGNIAHTFNNVLGGILGYAQLLKDEVDVDSTAHRHATVIESAAKRAANLVSQIYTFSNRHGGSDTRIIDPQKLVEDVVALLKSSLPPDITISTVFNHGDNRVRVDYPSICQVLLNVGQNACEAMPEGGELTFATYHLEKGKQNGRANGAADHVVFKITDTGHGIAEDFLLHIFEPFVSTHENKIAGGLGLTIAKAIMEDHGGDISVESQVDHGTLVCLRIPVAEYQPAVLENPLIWVDEDESTPVIMVVDDEEDLRDLAKSIFERKGYHVLLADSGDSALRVFEENHKQIDLVILDVAMPGLRTEEVYRYLKGHHRKVKIILTSGHTRYSPNLKFLKDAKDPFMQKPWDLPELVDEVSRLLQQRKRKS